MRRGDEIVVCGQYFHTNAPVVLWSDPGGHNAYPYRHYGVREAPLTDPQIAYVRQHGWTLDFLRQNVDQFVLHYDVDALSSLCFKTLNSRGLSVHFQLDIDGTLYQNVDLQEETWHATEANGRSIGIEIANIGAYKISDFAPFAQWYAKDAQGKPYIAIPARFGNGNVRTPNFVGRPSRSQPVRGFVQGFEYRQYDFTPQQYDSLIKLTAVLCTIFPKIQCDYPRLRASLGTPAIAFTKQDALNHFVALAHPGEAGALIPHALSWEQFDSYQGILGHYHVQTDKQDPGPAFEWDYVIDNARGLMTSQALAANAAMRGHPARFVPSSPATKPK
jgi:N-acetyl-anhydromuramyl-L-alanine amidase AmpD